MLRAYYLIGPKDFKTLKAENDARRGFALSRRDAETPLISLLLDSSF